MDKAEKTETIERFARKEGDTGSTEVQVALLTQRINHLTGHMVANRHDYHTQSGIIKMVAQRRSLVEYHSRG